MNIVAHNVFAMNASRQLNITNKNKAKNTEKLSSGYRINRASDDAAGLSISEKMRKQIRGLSQGVRNTQDGVSVCQVADGALAEVSEMLHRMTELSVQSANGTNSDTDRQAIQKEISQIKQEIERIGDTTEFNTRKLFRDNPSTVTNTTTPTTPGTSGTTGTTPGTTSGKTYVTKERTIGVTVKGKPTDTAATTYSIASDTTNGVTIGTSTYAWADIKSANGSSLGDAKIQAGTYTLTHKGMSVDINVSEGQTLDNIAAKINGLNWSSNEKVISRELAVDNLKVVPNKKLATYTDMNPTIPKYNYIYADDTGLCINSGNKKSWNDLGIDLDNLVAGTYTFKDSSSEAEFSFDIKDGATKSGLIAGLNKTIITSRTSYDVNFIACANSTNSDCSLVPMQTGSYWGDKFTGSFSKTDADNLSVINRGGYQEYFKFTNENGKVGFRYAGGSASGPDSVSTSRDIFFKLSDDSEARLKNLDYNNASGIADWKSNPIVFEHGDSKIYFYLSNTGTSSIKSYNDLVKDSCGDAVNKGILLSFGSTQSTTPSHEINVYAQGTYGVNNINMGNVGKVTSEITVPEQQILNDKDTYQEEVKNPNPPTVNPQPPVVNPTNPDIHGGNNGIWIQSGAEAGQGMFLEIDQMNTTILGIKDVDVSTADGATKALDAVSGALEKVSANRSKIGAQQNRLEHTIANENNVVENTTAAESRIRDADIAKEMVEFSKNMILDNVGQAMLAQANKSNEGVLSLLQ